MDFIRMFELKKKIVILGVFALCFIYEAENHLNKYLSNQKLGIPQQCLCAK